MGFGPAMEAIKTYGIWSSFMAHLVETSFKKSVEEYGKSEEEITRVRRRVNELQEDVQKLETYKSMLDGKVSKLSREEKEASAKNKTLVSDLEVARSVMKATQEDLKKAKASIVPKSEKILTLQTALEECKLESVNDFDNGSNPSVSP